MHNTTQRDSNLDFMRIAAFLLLTCCHAADPFNATATYGATHPDPDVAFWGALWGSLVRSCVPLFVMLSGALLLPRSSDAPVVGMRQFYSRRIPRVLWPFLIWSVLYYLTPWLLGCLGYGANAVLLFFPYIENTNQTLSQAMQRVLATPYNFSYLAGHMWYIYMLVGLYLYMPIFSAWVRNASRRQKEFFLAVWAVSSLLPYFGEFVNRYSFGTCDWNQYSLFYYFAGFNGYLLLGHYIYTYVAPRITIARAAALAALFAAGFAVTFGGFRYIQSLNNPTPQQTELFWTYCTPNVIATSAALFVALRSVSIRRQRLCALLQNFTLCGFGIYMVHYFFVGPSYWLTTTLGVPLQLRIPASAVIILLAAWGLVAALGKALGRYRRTVLG